MQTSFDAEVRPSVCILQPYHSVNSEEKYRRAASILIDFSCAVYLVFKTLDLGGAGSEIRHALTVLFAIR